MSIILNTFTGNQAIAKFEAMLMDAAIGESGFLDGCEITYIGTNQVSIPASNGIIKGRKFTIQAETKACALASSGSMPGRIYLRMDLSDSVNPLQILSVAAATLPDLEMDEECNFTTGIYEVEIATYTASTTAISNLTLTYNTINTRMLLKSTEEVIANTEVGRLVDALVIKGLITNLNADIASLQWYVDNGFLPMLGVLEINPASATFNGSAISPVSILYDRVYTSVSSKWVEGTSPTSVNLIDTFTNNLYLDHVVVYPIAASAASQTGSITLYGSTDGTNWTQISDTKNVVFTTLGQQSSDVYINITNRLVAYKYLKAVLYSPGGYQGIAEFRVFGKQ